MQKSKTSFYIQTLGPRPVFATLIGVRSIVVDADVYYRDDKEVELIESKGGRIIECARDFRDFYSDEIAEACKKIDPFSALVISMEIKVGLSGIIWIKISGVGEEALYSIL